jgi:uncharacterized protein YneF (UPF0154 family)
MQKSKRGGRIILKIIGVVFLLVILGCIGLFQAMDYVAKKVERTPSLEKATIPELRENTSRVLQR